MKLLRELAGKLKLFCDLELAIVEKLEEHDQRLYKLEEDYKRMRGSTDSHAQSIHELRLILGELRRKGAANDL